MSSLVFSTQCGYPLPGKDCSQSNCRYRQNRICAFDPVVAAAALESRLALPPAVPKRYSARRVNHPEFIEGYYVKVVVNNRRVSHRIYTGEEASIEGVRMMDPGTTVTGYWEIEIETLQEVEECES